MNIFKQAWLFLNSRYGIPVTILLIGGIYIAIPISIQHHFTIPLFLLFGIWGFYILKTDRTRHQKALFDKRLHWLIEAGLHIEDRGFYKGFKGYYRGYFLRVYVDPDPIPYRYRGEVDICILLYYKPRSRSDGKRDIGELRRLEQDIDSEYSWWRFRDFRSRDRDMTLTMRMTQFTKQTRIKWYIERLIDKAIKHRLQPVTEPEVERWLNEDPALYGPNIEEFQKSFDPVITTRN